MEFSRQEYWSGQPFPSPGDLPDPEIEPGSPKSLQMVTAATEESREAPPNCTVSLTSQRHSEKLPEVAGTSQGNPLTLLVGMQTSTATMENSVEIP